MSLYLEEKSGTKTAGGIIPSVQSSDTLDFIIFTPLFEEKKIDFEKKLNILRGRITPPPPPKEKREIIFEMIFFSSFPSYHQL